MPPVIPQAPGRPDEAEAHRLAFPALILGNLFLACGPWMVRLADVGPVASGFWRLALAVPLLALLAVRGGGRLWPQRGVLLLVVLGGLFFAADLAAWHEGILRTKLANATLFGNCSSLIFAVYGFVALRMLPTPAQLVALVFAAIGAGLLLGSSYELSPAHLTGDLFAILAGLFYAFYLIAVDRARKAMAPLPLLALSTLAGTLPLLLLALAMGDKVMPHDWTPLLLLALGSQVFGQGLLVYAIGHVSPVTVGVALLTQPAATALIGWTAYGERLGRADIIGALLIGAALILIRRPAKVESPPGTSHLGTDRRAA